MYGNLGRIGVITLATDTSVHPEIQRLMPEGVHTYPAPILLPRGEVNAQALAEMLETDSLENAASILTWADAVAVGPDALIEPNAMVIAVRGADDVLSSRSVLLKGIDARGLTF